MLLAAFVVGKPVGDHMLLFYLHSLQGCMTDGFMKIFAFCIQIHIYIFYIYYISVKKELIVIVNN